MDFASVDVNSISCGMGIRAGPSRASLGRDTVQYSSESVTYHSTVTPYGATTDPPVPRELNASLACPINACAGPLR
jgi:hypothetical protein